MEMGIVIRKSFVRDLMNRRIKISLQLFFILKRITTYSLLKGFCKEKESMKVLSSIFYISIQKECKQICLYLYYE